MFIIYQLLPLFVMDVLGHLKGFPGLFVACLFSGALRCAWFFRFIQYWAQSCVSKIYSLKNSLSFYHCWTLFKQEISKLERLFNKDYTEIIIVHESTWNSTSNCEKEIFGKRNDIRNMSFPTNMIITKL